jgi:hypothetical protein
MANYKDIQHRFANKQQGKYGRICAGNVRYEGRSFYSYETVFGQWVDLSMNVCVIFDGCTSRSSQRHKLWKGLFPDDVHVFPLDLESNYSYYSHCNLVGTYADNDAAFTVEHRMQMIDHYVGRIYDQLEAINGGTRKGLENVSFKAWEYVEELCGLYRDTSIAKYLNWSFNKHNKKLAEMLRDGERNVETITDALFGEGTYASYMQRTERFRKADKKRAQMEMLCKRLNIRSPYEKWCRNSIGHEMSADDIRKMTAKERLDIHFKALANKEYVAHAKERSEKYNKNFRNAYKWIVGVEPQKSWCGYDDSVNGCVNKNNGEQYVWGTRHIFGFYWLDLDISFNYDNFRTSSDKEQWIEDFYAKCKEVADNRRTIAILERVKAHTKEKKRSWDDDIYVNDDYLRENTTEGEYNLCVEFIRKQDKHYADEEARRRAAEIARLKREEEERKEREHMEKVKREQIEECIKDGSEGCSEGCRNLWRKHLTSLSESENWYSAVAFKSDGDFFYNGNVLLRLNLNKDKVETSKGVRIPVEICKKMWKVVVKWHENPSCFKSVEIDTKGSGEYTISSYQNDILTAGCHKIAYCEMERVMNEINNIN